MWNTRINNSTGGPSYGATTSNVIFRENFVGNGSDTTFQLTSSPDNATFATGSWSAGRILNTYPAYVTDENNKTLYTAGSIFTRSKITVVSISVGGLVTLSAAPVNLDDLRIWYFYSLQNADSLSSYLQEDFVTDIEAEFGNLDDHITDTANPHQTSDANLVTTDITTNNATSAKHGFLPKLSNVATQFLNGQGNFTTPSGTTNSYLSTSFSSQTSVNVNHSFNAYPVVQIINGLGAMVIPLTVTHNTLNDFTVTFSTSSSGTIIASVGSPQPNSVIVVATNYTVLNTDKIIQSTASGVTITLPTAVGNTGRTYYVNNASSGDITLDANGTETINAELTQIIPQSSTIQIFSDGSNWWII